MKQIQAIKGMNDLLPSESPLWQYLESTVSETLLDYGYQEIRFPIAEQTDLFKRSIGEVTDIVEKEMYTFDDRNGESVTLRPEGTASCVRACEQNQLLYNRGTLTQKLWYMGPMFRYEKPQKGRYRQFHQIGVETYGIAPADIDAELILITANLWKTLGLSEHVKLQLNSLGSAEARAEYKAALVEYLSHHKDNLDDDSQRRLATNPLRILDSKSAQTQALLNDAPSLEEYLDEESKAHFSDLTNYLDALGIEFEVNTRLVRGLDYYNRTVFEWVTDKLGAQGTVCAGGRYDKLVEQLGGKPTPAVGFAMGVERLILLLQTLDLVPEDIFQVVDVYLVVASDVAKAFEFAEFIRDSVPGIRLQMHCGGGSFKSQMKKADKSGASIALILGESEASNEEIVVKNLRNDEPQITIKQNEIAQILV